ncbi:hypothetical protein [Aliarcobacter lanthieri]|uniref:hypothetical protein n=1 Tax=Aliarcobacter lanthieri TaxID=1355374 RepID=UPI00047E288C|nr:hypothetical protein [Aliarcobacter lanthieri]
MMVNEFIKKIIKLGLENILLYAFVLIVIHQSIALLLANIEKMHGAKVQFYWYDIPITLFFIFIFIYGIYNYEGK